MIQGMLNWMKYFVLWMIWTICLFVNPFVCLAWTFIGFVLGYLYNNWWMKGVYDE